MRVSYRFENKLNRNIGCKKILNLYCLMAFEESVLKTRLNAYYMKLLLLYLETNGATLTKAVLFFFSLSV